MKITITNPVYDRLLIQGLNSGQKMIVYDMFGRVIINKIADRTIVEVSMAGKPAGTYVVNVFESYNGTLMQGGLPKTAFKFIKL